MIILTDAWIFHWMKIFFPLCELYDLCLFLCNCLIKYSKNIIFHQNIIRYSGVGLFELLLLWWYCVLSIFPETDTFPEDFSILLTLKPKPALETVFSFWSARAEQIISLEVGKKITRLIYPNSNGEQGRMKFSIPIGDGR